MKLSLKWLNEFVDLKEYFVEPQALSDKLTSVGLEVEGFISLAEKYVHVVTGQIIELGRHPDADRLTVCQVDAGEGKTRQIVCGSKNHKQGDKVVVALPGALLPGDFAIKESKIRNVESRGMLCSESELGLKDESEGILILPKDSPVGMPYAEYANLDDVVFDLKVTANRADCLSHLGLAREIAAVLNRKLKLSDPKIKKGSTFTRKMIQLKLKDSEWCPRYAGRAIRGVKIGPSPDWLKARLQALDLNSINNVVDITNYVMMELGQPLHAFDVSQIFDQKIVIDRAQSGEKFKTLDGTELTLTGEELTIRDGQRAVALAGVVGGLNSGVTETTKDLFIESAHFTAETVRKTSRKHGVQTDSAYRFSRGTDPEGVLRAMDRACELIQELAGGEVASDFYDEYPKPLSVSAVSVELAYVEQRLGYPVPANDFEDWMRRLGCQIRKGKSKGSYELTPPIYRWDLRDRTDFVEEYGRLHGYESIGETFPPLTQAPTEHTPGFLLERQLTEIFVREGYSQAVLPGMTSRKFAQEFLGDIQKISSMGLAIASDDIAILNPLNEEMNGMRRSLVPGLFKTAMQNFRYGVELGRVFEIGFTFGKSAEKYEQYPRVAAVAWGQKLGIFDRDLNRPPVMDLKAGIENVLMHLLIQNFQWNAAAQAPDFLHPGQCAGLFVEGRVIGFVGSLHPRLVEESKMRVGVAVGEFDFEKLMRGQPRVAKVQGLSKFPQVYRDLAFVLPRSMAVAEVIREIKRAAGGVLQSVEPFDLFTGGSLSADQKSVAFRLILQDQTGTLTEEALTGLQSKIVASVTEKLKILTR